MRPSADHPWRKPFIMPNVRTRPIFKHQQRCAGCGDTINNDAKFCEECYATQVPTPLHGRAVGCAIQLQYAEAVTAEQFYDLETQMMRDRIAELDERIGPLEHQLKTARYHWRKEQIQGELAKLVEKRRSLAKRLDQRAGITR